MTNLSAREVNGRDANGDRSRLVPTTLGVDANSLYSIISSPNFTLAVNMGLLPGFSFLDKFGINPEITAATDPEDIIEQGGRIIYDPDGTAPIQFFSSSDVLDVGQVVTITGQDINRNEVKQTVTSNGQSNVSLSTALWRVYRMENDSLTGNDNVGTWYCHTDAAPVAGVPAVPNNRLIISPGRNQTLYAAYTVPLERVGFLYRGELGVELEGNTAAALSEYSHSQYESRRLGKLFKVKKSVTVFPANPFVDNRSAPDVIPSGTDIRLVADRVTADMGLWGTLCILLVDESNFSTSYLTAIGQPGF